MRQLSRAYRRHIVVDGKPVWAVIPVEVRDELAVAMTEAVAKYGRYILQVELPVEIDGKVVGRIEPETD